MTFSIVDSIIGGAFGLFGSYLGYRFSRRLALESIRITEFNRAAAIFRSAFTEEQRKIRSIVHADSIEPDFIYNLVKNAIVKHEIAFIRFEPYLNSSDIAAYRSAWKKYENPSGIIKKENPDPLLDYCAEGKSIEDCVHLVTSNIERLLEFAKLK